MEFKDYYSTLGVPKSASAKDIKQAETLLNRIIEGKEVKANPDDLHWARRSLAWCSEARPWASHR